jgi:hypothetical protein
MDAIFWEEIERARRMTPAERIREGFRLFEQGRDYIVGSLEETFRRCLPKKSIASAIA